MGNYGLGLSQLDWPLSTLSLPIKHLWKESHTQCRAGKLACRCGRAGGACSCHPSWLLLPRRQVRTASWAQSSITQVPASPCGDSITSHCMKYYPFRRQFPSQISLPKFEDLKLMKLLTFLKMSFMVGNWKVWIYHHGAWQPLWFIERHGRNPVWP